MAFRIEEQIAGLEISVEQVGRVHVLQTLEALVDNVLLVDVLQDVGPDNCVQVRVHEIENQVDITVVFGSDDVLESNDVFVPIKLLQEYDLSESTLGICCILEGVEVLFKGHDLFGPFVNGFPDNTVGSLAKFLEDFILFQDVGLNFFGHPFDENKFKL